MRKLNKVLSVLLAMVLVFSAASIGVEAAYVAYKDNAITSYDSIDKPILSTEQYAAMAMDEIDRMLAEENINVNFDLAGILSIEADFSSLDKSLDSIADVYKKAYPLLNTIGGDVKNIDFSALVTYDDSLKKAVLTCPKRGDSGKTDLDIFYAVFQFLADNAEIVGKVPYGNYAADTNPNGLDLGILSGFVDLDDLLDFDELIKKPVAKLVWPDTPKSELDLSKTIDEYIKIFINDLCAGTYSKNKSHTLNDLSDAIQYYVPGINNEIDLLEDSVYDIIEAGLRIALTNVGIPMANEYLPVAIGKLCGLGFDKDETGTMTKYTRNPAKDETNGLIGMMNTNFHLAADCIDVASWDADSSFFEHMNEIVGAIVLQAINPTILAQVPNNGWNFNGGNELLDDNIIAIARVILADYADELFSSYVEVLPAETVKAMTNEQILAYTLRSILNGSINSSDIPSSADTLEKVLFELMKDTNADQVPACDYNGKEATVDNIIQMLLDLAIVGLNQETNMNLALGTDEEEFAEATMDWINENYGGFVSEIEGEGWEALSYIIDHIIPSNWLPYDEDGNPRDNIRNILFDDLVGNILEFDFAGLFGILGQNEDGELNGTIISALLTRLTSIINYIIPGVFPDTYTYDTLEGLLDRDLLSDVIVGLLTGLNDRIQNGLAVSLLPLACSLLDLSTPAEFGYPYVSLEDNEVLDPTRAATFYMYNASSGINTNATDKYGNTPATPDKLYTYRINSVTTNMDDVTVSPAGGVTINGGTSQTFTINGDLASIAADPDANKVLKVTINYDVLEETGNVMTPNSLTATSYCYISTDKDDGSNRVKKDANPSGNLHLVYLNEAKYLSVKSKVSDIADITIDLQRNVSSTDSAHTLPATFTVNSVTVDDNLAGITGADTYTVNTTKKGGTWGFAPYVVSDATAELAEGLYTNNFSLTASPTQSASENIQFSQYIYVYNDFGLPGLLNNAISANRQEANYGTDDYEAEYVDFYNENTEEPDMVTETVNGSDAWARYEAAVEAAAAVVYRPRLVNSFESTHAALYEELAYELYCATQELEACSISSGAAGVKAALDAIITPDTYIDDATGEEMTYEYDDARHTYFGREDYVSYTYSNFKAARNDAKDLIEDDAKGRAISSVKAAYITHRLNLYNGRLIRTVANKVHLNDAITKYASIFNAGKQNWSTESWTKFTRAYNFAVAVNGEALGTVISGTSNLAGDGLRQTKVNEARGQLIRAAKRLVETSLADYTQLNKAIANAKASYDAGNTGYTALSWTTFKDAYEAAVSLVAQNLEASTANQALINNAVTALTNAVLVVEEAGGWDLSTSEELYYPVGIIEGFEKNFLVGLDDMMPFADGLIIATGSYTVEITTNSQGLESTGAIITICDGSGAEIYSMYSVLYGDVNGDAVIDLGDISEICAAELYATTWADYLFTDDYAETMAADVNHDGVVSLDDVSVIFPYTQSVYALNQGWAMDGDAITLEF